MLQEHFYIIKAEDLADICEAAHLWYKEMNEKWGNQFAVENIKAKMLRDALWRVKWDKGAKLIIDEL